MVRQNTGLRYWPKGLIRYDIESHRVCACCTPAEMEGQQGGTVRGWVREGTIVVALKEGRG